MRRRATPAAQWIALLIASAALGAALQALRIPAALLLGPMLAGIAIAAAGGEARVPNWAFLLAQGLIGCMIAKMAPLSIAGELLSRWPIFVFGVLAVIAVSTFLGWLLTRVHVLPGTAVLWGSSPGAATAMIVMAEAHGADARLVAFMQYLRVAVVAAGASVVARLWNLNLAHATADIDWFPPVAAWPLAETLALAILGPLLAHKLNIRSGGFLLPLVAGLLLSHLGLMSIELPPWLLLLSYALIGWSIGLRFTRSLLVHVARAFPRVLACMVTLILLCGVLAAVLVVTAGVDPLTAYLATSPGGADSVAIIAASSKVDVPFVMAMQTTRLVAVIFLAPIITRYLAELPRSRCS
ncbi:MAG: AbrB family transcriptional regulator [Proteobacteria bacterium]|nr:AbrB family transcriptional regulator [Pseudomonadota bacterium]